MRKAFVIGLLIFISAVTAWLVFFGTVDSRVRAEREHGVALPPSAVHIQCKGDAWRGFLDRGAATMFEMNTNDMTAFLGQLQVRSRASPSQSTGDPTISGYNVWPKNSQTFVPGNPRYGGFRHTWQGDALPVEMLSCASPKGDWLHVELWRLNGGMMLVKMYTDWN